MISDADQEQLRQGSVQRRHKGLLRKDDPKMLAFSYTTPISALIHLCDREPVKTEDAIKQIEAFSRHFVRIYGQED